MELLFERVYTIEEWDEGPRAGVANFAGAPHFFRSRGEAGDRFELTPLPSELFAMLLEADALFHRWQPGPSTHRTTASDGAAVPGGEDRVRYERLRSGIAAGLASLRPVAVMRADFDFDPDRVRWMPVDVVRTRPGPSPN
ncbi:MAG: hypothetical protein ACT4PJ_03130 [Gemmatimonadaceae bacterium]